MTAKESAQMRKLMTENARLKEQLERSMSTYREQIWELVELRARLDLVREAMEVSE